MCSWVYTGYIFYQISAFLIQLFSYVGFYCSASRSNCNPSGACRKKKKKKKKQNKTKQSFFSKKINVNY